MAGRVLLGKLGNGRPFGERNAVNRGQNSRQQAKREADEQIATGRDRAGSLRLITFLPSPGDAAENHANDADDDAHDDPVRAGLGKKRRNIRPGVCERGVAFGDRVGGTHYGRNADGCRVGNGEPDVANRHAERGAADAVGRTEQKAS